jgi:hypothetical protein
MQQMSWRDPLKARVRMSSGGNSRQVKAYIIKADRIKMKYPHVE